MRLFCSRSQPADVIELSAIMPRAFLVKSAVRPAHQPYVRPWTDQDSNDENNNSDNVDNLNCRIGGMIEHRIPLPIADELRHRDDTVTSSSPLAVCDSTPSRLDAFRRKWRNRRPLEGLTTNVEMLSGTNSVSCGLETVTSPVAGRAAVRHSGELCFIQLSCMPRKPKLL